MNEAVAKIDAHRARRIGETLTSAPDDWRQNLARRGDRFIGDERNVLLALRLAPDLSQLVRFNEFTNSVEFARVPPWRKLYLGDPWTDADDLELQAWLQRHDVDVRHRGIVADTIVTVARDWLIHPVRSYLNTLTWDGEPRLQCWLAEYLNATGPTDYLAIVGAKFLISCVARVMQPGCQVDHVLVLEARQGAGKSEAVGRLGKPWTTDGLGDLQSKDSAIHLAGVWIVELAELAAMRRSETEAMKAFITRRIDRFRPPFARRAIDVPRQCVFVATTNETQYLRDRTGNRRFWPVRCGRIDLEAIERDRDQLWAEALHRFRAEEAWHPVGDEISLVTREQEDRVLVTELEERVTDYLERQTEAGIDEISAAQVFVNALGVDPSIDVERAGRLGRQLAEAMQQAGWHRVSVMGRGKNRRTLYRKADLIGIHRDKSTTTRTARVCKSDTQSMGMNACEGT